MLERARVRPLAVDLADGDLSAAPEDFDYVFHAAVDPGFRYEAASASAPRAGEWERCVRVNAQMSGELLFRCRSAKGFVYCSTGSIYGYPGQRPITEADPPGVPLSASYSFSKVAAEQVCTWISRQFSIPLTIIRICSTYGARGGAPADRLEAILERWPIRLYSDPPNNYNPSYEDDYIELGIRALEVSAVPPVVMNWAGSETVSVEDYCRYLGELVDIEPIFEYTNVAHTPLWPDVTRMHEILGATKVSWQDGFRRMVKARHTELVLTDEGQHRSVQNRLRAIVRSHAEPHPRRLL